MIRFAYPHLLWLLWLIPIWAVLLVWAGRRRRKASGAFSGIRLVDRLTESLSHRRLKWKMALWLAAWCLFTLGAADPQVGTKLEEVKREGIDVVIALDVSNSMLCQDLSPSRLENAKHEILRFIDGLQGDRVGLVVFAGSAILHCPLTTDYGAAKLLTRVMNTDLVPEQGTALSDALDESRKAFDQGSGGSRLIVVISDGEDHEEQAVEAAQQANNDGILVYAIGMGTAQGAPIPIKNPKTGLSDYKRDQNGNVVVTRLNEVLLRQVADAGGGEYYRATQSGQELDAIWSDISQMQKREFGKKQFTAFEDRFQYLILPGLLLLLAEFLLGDRKRRWVWKSGRSGTTAIARGKS
jgi:Ca-activated chloride channel family protein